MPNRYQLQNSFEKRLASHKKIIEKNSNHIPVIVQSKCPKYVLKQFKFVINRDDCLGKLMTCIRRRVSNLEDHDAIFCFIRDRHLYTPAELMGKIYDERKDTDLALYITIRAESCFG